MMWGVHVSTDIRCCDRHEIQNKTKIAHTTPRSQMLKHTSKIETFVFWHGVANASNHEAISKISRMETGHPVALNCREDPRD